MTSSPAATLAMAFPGSRLPAVAPLAQRDAAVPRPARPAFDPDRARRRMRLVHRIMARRRAARWGRLLRAILGG